MFTFLLIVQTLVAASMVAVILMQRSEGGGLGVGGSPAGLMSARGAADFLTRATSVLGTLFILLSIALAGLAAVERAPVSIDPALMAPRPGTGAPAGTPAGPFGSPATNPGAPPVTDPLRAGPAPAQQAPAAAGNSSVPPVQ